MVQDVRVGGQRHKGDMHVAVGRMTKHPMPKQLGLIPNKSERAKSLYGFTGSRSRDLSRVRRMLFRLSHETVDDPKLAGVTSTIFQCLCPVCVVWEGRKQDRI